MPKVGDKEYDYDEEGMEEAKAEAADSGQDVQMADDSFVVAIEKAMEAPKEEPKEESEGEPKEESEGESKEKSEGEPKEESKAAGLFMEVFGEEYDPEDEEHQEHMESISELMEANPEASSSELVTMYIRGNVVLAD